MTIFAIGLARSNLARPISGNDTVSVKASPFISVEPGFVNLMIRHVPRDEDRDLLVEIDSPNFLRSSLIALDGAGGPPVHWLRFRNLPTGDYLVRVSLERSDNRGTSSKTSFRVLGTPRIE